MDTAIILANLLAGGVLAFVGFGCLMLALKLGDRADARGVSTRSLLTIGIPSTWAALYLLSTVLP